MKTKKQIPAFTIAEALLTFTLMGAIFVISIGNININNDGDDYKKLYWQAFNTLYQASKAYHDEWEQVSINNCNTCNNDLNQATCYIAKCWRNSKVKDCPGCEGQERDYAGGTANIDRDFPGFLYNYSINNALVGKGQDKEFCEKLVSKINTFPSGRCESFISIANPDKLKNDSSAGGVNFYDAFSYAIENEDGTFKQINPNGGISPSFTAMNGQKFFISSVVTANSPGMLGSTWAHFDHPSRESYRFVVVDLNGDSKPNSQFRSGKRNPDLVLFAINSMGDVIPLGLPEFSKSYINARVYYPNDLDEDGTRLYPKKSEPMILFYAKKHAFGNQECGGSTSPLPYGSGISSIEPFSQSARFYSVAMKCKDDIGLCTKKDAANGGIYADNLFIHLVEQFLFIREGVKAVYPYIYKSECIKNSSENGCKPISAETDSPTCAIDIDH